MATVREACVYGRFGHTKCYDYINEGKIIAIWNGHSRYGLHTRACHQFLTRIPKASSDFLP